MQGLEERGDRRRYLRRRTAVVLVVALVSACTPVPSQAPTTSEGVPTAPVATPLPTPSQAPEPTVTTFVDGTYRVGDEISPGTYRSWRTGAVDAEDFCYWERVSGFGGSAEEVIATSAGTGSRVVTIAASDAGFVSSGCGTWSADLKSPNVPLGDGVWIVGVDLDPSVYRSDTGEICLWQRLSGFGGTDGETLEVGTGNRVTVLPTDAGFTSLNCGTWRRE